VELYEFVSGKKLSPDDIIINTLKDGVIGKTLYNDASFITKDGTFVALLEHQSTTNENMHLRFLEYYIAQHKESIAASGKTFHDAKYTNPPYVEFYVAYNGRADFSDISETLDLGGLMVNASFVDIRLENVLERQPPCDKSATMGYALLIKEYQNNLNNAMTPEESYAKALQAILKGGFLMSAVNAEAVQVLAKTWTREEIVYKRGFDQGVEDGIEIAARAFSKRYNISIEDALKILAEEQERDQQ